MRLPWVATPPPLPAGPAWERLLFESPWPLMVLFAAAAVIAFFIFRRRARTAAGTGAGAGLVAVAIGLWVLARQVTTEREEIQAAAAELVDAAAKADIPRLDRLLDDSAAAYTNETPNGMPKSRILAEVRQRLGEEFPIKEYTIEESQAVIDGPGVARAQLRVYAVEAGSGAALSSWWGLDMRRDESGHWRTTAIRPLHPLIAPQRSR